MRSHSFNSEVPTAKLTTAFLAIMDLASVLKVVVRARYRSIGERTKARLLRRYCKMTTKNRHYIGTDRDVWSNATFYQNFLQRKLAQLSACRSVCSQLYCFYETAC